MTTPTELPALTHTTGLPDYMVKEAIDARAAMLARLEEEITSRAPADAPADLTAEMLELFRGALIRQTGYGWWMYQLSSPLPKSAAALAHSVMTKEEKAKRLELARALAAGR